MHVLIIYVLLHVQKIRQIWLKWRGMTP